MLFGLAFSPAPLPSLTEAGRFRKVSLPSVPLSVMSRMLDGILHRVAEDAGSKTDMAPAFVCTACRNVRNNHLVAPVIFACIQSETF